MAALAQKEWQHGLHNLRGVKEMSFMQQELSPGPSNYKAAELKKAKGVTKWVVPSTARRLAKPADSNTPSYMKETKTFSKRKGKVEGVAYSPRREQNNETAEVLKRSAGRSRTPTSTKRTLTPRKTSSAVIATPTAIPVTATTPTYTPPAVSSGTSVFDRLYSPSVVKHTTVSQSPYQSPQRIQKAPLVLGSDHPAFGQVSAADRAVIQEKIRQLSIHMTSLNRQPQVASWVQDNPTMSPSPSPCIAPERYAV